MIRICWLHTFVIPIDIWSSIKRAASCVYQRLFRLVQNSTAPVKVNFALNEVVFKPLFFVVCVNHQHIKTPDDWKFDPTRTEGLVPPLQNFDDYVFILFAIREVVTVDAEIYHDEREGYNRDHKKNDEEQRFEARKCRYEESQYGYNR